MIKAKMQPVIVHWHDARSSSRWMDQDEFEAWRGDWGDREIQSCGLLAHYSDQGVVIVLSQDMKNDRRQQIAHCLEIPKGMVKKVVVL